MRGWVNRYPMVTATPPKLAQFALLGSVALGLLVLSVGCGEPEQKEIRIGLIAPITGSIPNVGQSSVDSANLFVNDINDSGGVEIGGEFYKLVLLVEDNEDKAEVAANKAHKLINQLEVVAIVGPQASRNAIPASNVAEQFRIPMITPGSTNPMTTLNKKWVFRATFIDSFQGSILAGFSKEQLGVEKVAVLFDIASEYNKGLAEVFKSSFEALGGRVVAFESYTTDAPDVTEQLLRIKEVEAGVLFLPNYYSEVADQVRLAKELGIDARMIGGDSWAGLPHADRTDLEGGFFSTVYAADEDDSKVQQFVNGYVDAYGKKPDALAALTYDAFGLLVEAIKNQAEVGPAAVREGMAAIRDYRGVTGSFRYDGTSGDPIRSVVMMKIENGEFVVHSRLEP